MGDPDTTGCIFRAAAPRGASDQNHLLPGHRAHHLPELLFLPPPRRIRTFFVAFLRRRTEACRANRRRYQAALHAALAASSRLRRLPGSPPAYRRADPIYPGVGQTGDSARIGIARPTASQVQLRMGVGNSRSDIAYPEALRTRR